MTYRFKNYLICYDFTICITFKCILVENAIVKHFDIKLLLPWQQQFSQFISDTNNPEGGKTDTNLVYFMAKILELVIFSFVY